MMCFHFDIGSPARHAGRFIGRVRGELLRALSERKAETGLSQQTLARKLDADRAQINRQLSGEASLSLRSLADLAWAMDMEISFELKRLVASAGWAAIARRKIDPVTMRMRTPSINAELIGSSP